MQPTAEPAVARRAPGPRADLRTLWVTDDSRNSLTPIDPRTSRAGLPVPVADPYHL